MGALGGTLIYYGWQYVDRETQGYTPNFNFILNDQNKLKGWL